MKNTPNVGSFTNRLQQLEKDYRDHRQRNNQNHRADRS
jgi:hypothetical protein